MDTFDDLVPALSELLGRLGTAPLNINVSMCDAEVVADLKARVALLEAEREQLIARTNRAEFLARCNSVVSMRVVDYARENGLKIPRKLYDGLDKF